MKFKDENKNEENIQKEVSACVKNPIIHKQICDIYLMLFEFF